ncbi:lipopolysaccharide cholinephosphotransferase [Paenibacillus polysaccharolyticus]|uniref:Lipopolysaccharide cholinephosphotransferase n=1 Tax=Paenibacillus polysaccharolyticus TaxID=582692 RepID=A0A1G5KC19_9BACL|nr:LicD family protein [Paenibacillus polysaccharolyticus]SCY98172.1 lipopolysaccharide cholinephosphotransferase [Paenibacillus polysaccharolyticus]
MENEMKLNPMKKGPLTPEDLRAVQRIQIEMLVEVDRICRMHDINYAMIGGTMLGAIRHKGYIPWDDDADIGLLREEYEKFRQVCETDLDHSRFYFQDMRATPGYRWGYGKIRRKDTYFLREGQAHMPYESGIFIDIFPFDNVPDGKIAEKFHNFHCTVIRKILWSEVGKKTDRNPVLRGVYSLLSRIPLQVVSNHLQHFTDRGNRKKSKRVRTITFPAPDKYSEGMKEWFEQTAEYPFESFKLLGHRNSDAYLRHKFGDYMELPPESKRKSHPVSSYKLL